MHDVVTALLAQSQTPTPPVPEETPSGGMAWWAYLIWAWAVVSLCVYGYRLVRRFTGHKPERGSGATPTTPADGTPGGTAGAPSPATPTGASTDETTGAGLGATLRKAVERPATPLPEPPTGPSPTEALFLEAKAAKARGDDPDAVVAAAAADDDAEGPPASDRRGLFATQPDDDPPRRPVAELVRGIELPCELVPVVEGADPDGHHVAFHTAAADPARVGRELGDALEAIGYALRSTSDTEVVATRDTDELRVRIVPRAGDARDEGRPRYPTLPSADVVVELTS